MANSQLPASPPSDGDLTVVVFHENDASRSFRVSLAWIRKLGWLLGILAFAALTCGILAVRFYRVSKLADPERVRGLEHDLRELRLANQALESKASAPLPAPSANTLTTETPAATPAATASTTNTATAVVAAPVPTVTVTVTATPAPAAAAPVAAATEPGSMPFSLFPAGTQAVPANVPRPIVVAQPKITVTGHTLHVRFAFQYTATEGSQQGRFVLLARAPDSIQSYPAGALDGKAGSGGLLVPGAGEYFSVSRYREVNAEFVGSPKGAVPRTVEVLVFTTDGKVFMHQTLNAEAAAPEPARKPKPKAKAMKPAAPAPQAPAESKAAPAAPAAPQAAPAQAPAPAQPEGTPNAQ